MADRGQPPRALRWAGLALVAASTASAVSLFRRKKGRREDAPAATSMTGRGRPRGAPSAASRQHGYEVGDANVRVIATIMVVAITFMVGGLAAVYTMYGTFSRHDRLVVAPITAEQQAPITPPGPHLQDDPYRDIKAVVGGQEKTLTTYGWADADHKRAHVPIVRAMDEVVGKPLDGAPAGAPTSADPNGKTP